MRKNLTQLPVRTNKARENGLTMMMDKGLSLRQAEDFLSSNREHTDIIKLGSEKAVKEAGLAKLQGKEYIVCDGDCIYFHFNV